MQNSCQHRGPSYGAKNTAQGAGGGLIGSFLANSTRAWRLEGAGGEICRLTHVIVGMPAA
jgi:hypothetical protein